MKKMTESNLQAAFTRESQTHMRYLLFADKAEQEGYPNLARLFRATAYAEQVHAVNHLMELGAIKSSAENLEVALADEVHQVEEMYPVFRAVADMQGETGARMAFSWALEGERGHAALYRRAREAVERGEDVQLGDVYVCEMSGYTVEGDPPGRCPVCSAASERFRKF